MTLAPGTHLGRYEIRSKVGAGGMGEVCLAKDSKLNQKLKQASKPAAHLARIPGRGDGALIS